MSAFRIDDLVKLTGYVFQGEIFVRDEMRSHMITAIYNHLINTVGRRKADNVYGIIEDHVNEVIWNLETIHELLKQMIKQIDGNI